MRRLRDIAFLRLRSLLRRSRVEGDLDRELAFHVEQQVEENLAHGMPPEAARAAAIRSLGARAQIQEECRDMRRTNQLETIWSDLRYALRNLRRTPAFTIIIILTLGLSVGANSAIFSVIEGVLLRPLPYARPDRLVRIHFKSDNFAKFPLNPNDFLDLRARNRSFESMAALTRHDLQLSGAGEPVMLRSFRITSGYFHLLGLHPALGREFTREDELPGRGCLAIVSDRLWRTRFGSDSGILGRMITLNAQACQVVGIMPPGTLHPGNNFHAVPDGDTVDLWKQYIFDDDPRDRGSHFLDGIGRLKPGVSPEQGTADLSGVLAQLIMEHPEQKGWKVFLVPLQQEMVGRTRRMLLVLLGAVGLLLLLACVNAANLLLARSSARVREIAVRAALGAARGRIVRQLLTESVAIAVAAGALGTLLAAGGVRVLVTSLPAGFPRASEIHLDATVFGFTLLVAVLTGFVFGLVPALTASRIDLQQSLRENGRSVTGTSRQLRLRNFLVVGESGLACVLLVVAGLLLHSFVKLLRADPGFRTEQVLTASISLPFENYRDERLRVRFYERLTSEVGSLPGVEAAGVGTDLPWTGYDGNAGFAVEGRSAEFNNNATARYHAASPGYFQALEIPLLRGRYFTVHDKAGAPVVLIVNEAMARRFWPGEDALQKRIAFRSKPQEQDWVPVVGIVGDINDQAEATIARPAFWLPHAQSPEDAMSLVIRSHADPAVLTRQLRLVVRRLDPQLALADVRLMNQIADAAVSSQRFALFGVGLFAALALVLAAFGMYGVVSYAVNQRMHEFGMRMALGAGPGDLMRLIMGQGLRLSVGGAVAGLFCAAGLARFLGSLTYGVSGSDPVTFIGVAVLTVTTGALACYLPARRATKADPLGLLRSD